jgi:hypothetical protein
MVERRWRERGEEPRFIHHRPAISSNGSPARSDPFVVSPAPHQTIAPPSPLLMGMGYLKLGRIRFPPAGAVLALGPTGLDIAQLPRSRTNRDRDGEGIGVTAVCREKEIKGVDGMETSIQMRFDCIQTSIHVRFVARKRYSYCDPEGEKGI